MAISIRSTQVPAPPKSSPSQYQTALVQLPRAWPFLVARAAELPEPVKLTSDCFVLLSLLLTLGPDRECKQGGQRKSRHVNADGTTTEYVSRTHGLAQWLGWPRSRVWRAVDLLNAAALLWGLLLEKGDLLNAGSLAATNIVRYRVHVAAIMRAYLDIPTAYYTADQGMRRRRGPDPKPSGGPDLGPSLVSEDPGQPPTLGGAAGALDAEGACSRAPAGHHEAAASPQSAPTAPTPRDLVGAAGDRPGASPLAPAQSAGREGEHALGQTIDTLVAAWDALKIPESGGTVSRCRKSERTLFAKRLADVGAEACHAAIVGASVTPWIRRADQHGIFAACARVFGTAAHVQDFAQRGRAELAARVAAGSKHRNGLHLVRSPGDGRGGGGGSC